MDILTRMIIVLSLQVQALIRLYKRRLIFHNIKILIGHKIISLKLLDLHLMAIRPRFQAQINTLQLILQQLHNIVLGKEIDKGIIEIRLLDFMILGQRNNQWKKQESSQQNHERKIPHKILVKFQLRMHIIICLKAKYMEEQYKNRKENLYKWWRLLNIQAQINILITNQSKFKMVQLLLKTKDICQKIQREYQVLVLIKFNLIFLKLEGWLQKNRNLKNRKCLYLVQEAMNWEMKEQERKLYPPLLFIPIESILVKQQLIKLDQDITILPREHRHN